MKLSNKSNFISAGLIVSVLAVAVAIYQGYQSNLNAEIARIETRIGDVRKELSEPMVYVDIRSIAELLDKELIALLGTIPSAIEIEHIRGDTAR